MTALAASFARRQLGTEYRMFSHPVNAGSVIYAGSLVARESATGMLIPAADTAGIVVLGVAKDALDNTSGADGVANDHTPDRDVRVYEGVFEFIVGAGTPLPGNPAYVSDDNTVSANATTNKRVAGVFVREASSSSKWWVDTTKALEMQRAIDLSSGGASALVAGVAAGYKVARGVAAVTGTLTVVTGLATVVAVVAAAEDDPDGVALAAVSATIGDQAGSPAAGSVIVKAWKVTAVDNATLIAASAEKSINWIAVGT